MLAAGSLSEIALFATANLPSTVLGPPDRLDLRMAMAYLRRTPGLSSGEPMNSMPAFSRVFIIKSRVCALLEGMPSASSIRLTVATPTFDFSANSLALQLISALAALI